MGAAAFVFPWCGYTLKVDNHSHYSSVATGQSYNFFSANWRLASIEIYSSIRYQISFNRNNWHILMDNEERIVKE